MSNKPIKNKSGVVPPAGYKLNPLSDNWIYCPDPKVINPETGRCVNPSSKSLTKKVVSISTSSSVVLSENKPIINKPGLVPPADYKLNPLSDNWIYCPDPKVINPETGRCFDPSSKSLTKKVVSIPTSSVVASSSKPKQSIMSKIIEDYMISMSKMNLKSRRKSQPTISKTKTKVISKRRMTV